MTPEEQKKINERIDRLLAKKKKLEEERDRLVRKIHELYSKLYGYG